MSCVVCWGEKKRKTPAPAILNCRDRSVREFVSLRCSKSPCELYSAELRLSGDDGDVRTALGLLDELDSAINKSEDGVILAHADVSTRMMLGAALTKDDVACLACLTAEKLQAKSFAFAVTAVLRATLTFFMCHFV